MLQVKDVVKKYTTKGETVTALDHVSVDFPEKGMVFLLGKSGSGKSTLLNISGGLDEPDEGELIVKGKSSKNFSPSDFDSYRNTYVGFIFQEYNILTELTVAENVALALELQGQPCDEEHVNALLEQVDLAGMGDRRPNTLSGGQKQRVAIARALVKNPEIIMGDEPTGALDSATGKQVFDTLKKLSEEKLVVIVSHDRDFAESYADRIIELRDGHIISDLSRGSSGELERTNYSELSEKKLCIASGTDMTDEEGKRVLDFLKRTKGSIVITAEKEDIENIPEINTYSGFERTKLEPVPPQKDEAKFIRSKFPVRYAVKMGVSGLKVKPLRLIFTTLLATIAFIVFGVFSTLMTYNSASLGATTLSESYYSAAILAKYGVLHMQNGDREYTTKLATGVTSSHFSNEEIESLQKSYPKMDFIPAYTLNIQSISLTASQSRTAQYSSDYYGSLGYITAFVNFSDVKHYLDEKDSEVMTLVAGSYPTAADECLISQFVFETYCQYPFLYTTGESSGKTERIETYSDLIGKTISFNSNGGSIHLRITGIVDTHENFESYEHLKDSETATQGMTQSEFTEYKRGFQELFKYTMAAMCYVGDGFLEANIAFDPYVSSGEISREMRRNVNQAISNEYFVSSNYLKKVQYEGEDDWMSGFFPYTVNEEAEALGSYCQYLLSPLKENTDYKSKTIMKLDARVDNKLDISYEAPYAFMSDIRAGEETFHQIFSILCPAAVVLAVFAALLLFNFINASINGKKKDIGILRAVGARGIDVFKIFIVEGIAITLFCFILGSLGAFGACAITNTILLAKGIFGYKLFSFGIINVVIVLAIAFVTAVVATLIPVCLTVKKKPVEAIRSI